MKYDERLMQLADLIEKKKSIPKLKEELLEILFKRFSSKINQMDYEQIDGLLEETFLMNLYSSKDEGIDKIIRLQESDELDSFAEDYCMIFEDVYSYEAQGYKVIWDYQTYCSELEKQPEKSKKLIKS